MHAIPELRGGVIFLMKRREIIAAFVFELD